VSGRVHLIGRDCLPPHGKDLGGVPKYVWWAFVAIAVLVVMARAFLS